MDSYSSSSLKLLHQHIPRFRLAFSVVAVSRLLLLSSILLCGIYYNEYIVVVKAFHSVVPISQYPIVTTYTTSVSVATCSWSQGTTTFTDPTKNGTIKPTTTSASTTGSCSTSSSRQRLLYMTKIIYNGKSKEFKAGSPLSKAVSQLGCKVTYSCRKGDCATCQVVLDGRMVRCCTGKVPDSPNEKGLLLQA